MRGLKEAVVMSGGSEREGVIHKPPIRGLAVVILGVHRTKSIVRNKSLYSTI